MRNYYDVVSDLKGAFESPSRKEEALTLLKDNDLLFWEYLSLVHLCVTQVYMDEKPGASVLALSTKFINHTATAYEALLNSMVDEFFILFRQSYEVKWLIEYFVKYPEKEADWLSAKKNYIPPKQVRKAIDENDRMKSLYSYLSSGAHPKTQSISHILKDNFVLGGNYDKKFTEYGFLMILRTIEEFVEELLEIVQKQQEFDMEDLQSKRSRGEEFNEDEELFILAVGQYSILVERLNEFQSHIDS